VILKIKMKSGGLEGKKRLR